MKPLLFVHRTNGVLDLGDELSTLDDGGDPAIILYDGGGGMTLILLDDIDHLELRSGDELLIEPTTTDTTKGGGT